jgi:hypothetical protein
VENENQQRKNDSVFSKKIRAGRRRTYFFDIKATKANDYYLTITESKKKPNDEGYERHKIFLYKEDFNKFIEAVNETINHVKTELMPDYDFDEFDRKQEEYYKLRAAEGDNHHDHHQDGTPEPAADKHSEDGVSNTKPENKPTESEETGNKDDVDSW